MSADGVVGRGGADGVGVSVGGVAGGQGGYEGHVVWSGMEEGAVVALVGEVVLLLQPKSVGNDDDNGDHSGGDNERVEPSLTIALGLGRADGLAVDVEGD